MQTGIKVFQALSVKDHPTIIDDKKSPDLSNVRIDNPIGALSNIRGISKYNSVGYGNPIVAIHQLNGHIFSLKGGTAGSASGSLFEGLPTFNDYTAITNCVELQAMQDNLAGKYYLANDIDCTYCTQNPAGALYNAGAGFAPVGDDNTLFTGIFDGNGHTITGLYLNRTIADEGLFGHISSIAQVKNVGMIDVNINCSQGQISGLAGTSEGTITNCYSTGEINGRSWTGGLVGINTGTIINCYSTAEVNDTLYYTGGLVGGNTGTITNCYSAGAVSGGSDVGGLIGYNSGGTYNDCFWDIETSGQARSAGGTGKLTADMYKEATFTNWDFSTIWTIVEDTSYPTLR